jgi:hypothetical protein
MPELHLATTLFRPDQLSADLLAKWESISVALQEPATVGVLLEMMCLL